MGAERSKLYASLLARTQNEKFKTVSVDGLVGKSPAIEPVAFGVGSLNVKEALKKDQPQNNAMQLSNQSKRSADQDWCSSVQKSPAVSVAHNCSTVGRRPKKQS